jgi:hypothetical protein
MGGQDDAGRAGAFGAAADRAKIVWIGDSVEADENRVGARRQLVSVRVAVWLADRDGTLVVARPRKLGERLRINPLAMRDHEAYLQADESVPYGSVVRVMGIMRASGITKLGIVTDPLVSQ